MRSYPAIALDHVVLSHEHSHMAGGERDILDVRQLTANLGNWVLDDHQRHLITGWDFGVFANPEIARQNDIRLITVLVDRRMSETNLFHFTFVKMTITLGDVYMIFRLPITGRVLPIRSLSV